ncbi:hypothetical protein V6N11_024193 [Hibiscus sabdariffa]|uniref:Uncharacterized protein n=2 Tax=Hibiscus sabdariffa TaxID=183260 RepID=A0ABR2N7T9_9ROSI
MPSLSTQRKAPVTLQVCLNVDGVVSSSSDTSSIKELFRDRNDIWILGFTKAIGIPDVLHTELWTVLTGLELGFTMDSKLWRFNLTVNK